MEDGGSRTTDGVGYQFEDNFKVTKEIKEDFSKEGFIIIRKLLDSEEVTKLRNALENDQGLKENNYARDDGEGRRTKVTLWNHPGNDVTGIISRSEKVAGTMEELLGGEVYHYHAKVIMKEPFTGGAHIWHQDYGYWYENGCLFPDMGTVWVAIDRADMSNGCLKILPRSHLAGRINHVPIGDQVGADLKRVEELSKVLPLTYVQLDPGDALFFHSNILHRSDQNNSPNRRWAFLVSFNRASNNPVYDHHHPKYTPLKKVPNSAIKSCDIKTTTDGKDFFHGPKDDFSLKQVKKAKLEA
ncbi:uncharacterized protein LOC106159669 [Lingula anatina]|uniref:Uncharacterized protein LOC106159669 n=1 Tax=Lingula anatina TaxID=7574 RepID=A0A1S3HZP1_LINAN|nr:uncharacterized protein LOC106159669 [Lingula anatina]|eukprot:XP_013391482.1 uncharacterized protein LOC106159669 [Lingula anatina]